MKIVNISGGLGNQMFQYAFALSLKVRFPDEDVYVDTSHYHTLFFKHYKGISLHNGFELDKLFTNVDIPIAGCKELAKVSYYIPNYVLSRVGRKILPVRKTEFIPPYSDNYIYLKEAFLPGNRYYEGFWQCIKYYSDIKEQLIEVYSHPQPNEYNSNLISDISKNNSVGIHVRRGDYLKQPVYRNICNAKYYEKAINNIMSDGLQHTFFIFSNDINWCRNNIMPLVKDNECVFVTGNRGKESYWDMFLMTYCKDLVIANSSFSWWGAFLNKREGRIFAPKRWLNSNYKIDLYDESWIKV